MLKQGFKYFIIIIFLSSFSFAGLIDGISLTVNNAPITLLEISNYAKKFNIPVKVAMRALIQQKIEDALIKKYHIRANDSEIKNKIKNISTKAGMTLKGFDKFIISTGISLKQYKIDLSKKIEKRKLYKKITFSKIHKASEKDLKAFYNKHIDIYSMPSMVDVIKYISNDRNSLHSIINNPIMNLKNVFHKESILKTKELNPKILSVLLQTKVENFTPIFNINKKFMSLYIKRKINVKVMPFSKVKKSIFFTIMNTREKNILKSYFDKLISKAQIKIIREPK